MRLLARPIMIVTMMMGISCPAVAETQGYQPAPLVILFRAELSRMAQGKRDMIKQQWKEACKALQEAFTKGKATFGSGPFASAQCILRKNLLAKDTKDLGPDYWVLDLGKNDNVLDVELTHYVKKAKVSPAQLEVQFSLELSEDPLTTLANPQKLAPIAGMIFDKAPFAYAFKAYQGAITHSFTVPNKESIPKYPKSLIVYGLDYNPDKDIWVPEPVGIAEVSFETKAVEGNLAPAANEGDKAEGEEGEDRAEKPGAKPAANEIRVNVTLKPQIKKIRIPYTWYFAHDIRGRGLNTKELTRQLNEINNALTMAPGSKDKDGKGKEEPSLSKRILNQIAAGYAGIRFGQSIAKGEPLLENARFLGILAEIRSGILDGLRFNADIGLEQKIRQDDLDLSFRWRRYTLGWAFGRDIDFFFNRIDLTPRLGIMDIRSTLPVPSPTEENQKITTDFNMVDAFNFGAELGIEKNFSFAMLRLWGASDFAVGFLEKAGGGRGTITSFRAGVDTYFELFRLADALDVNLLLFGLGERISLSQSVSEDQQSLDSPTIEGLSYSFGFLGAGLTISW